MSDRVIDLTCSICKGGGTYQVRVRCSNCGAEGIGTFSKGHETGNRRCPDCDTTNIRKTVSAERTGTCACGHEKNQHDLGERWCTATVYTSAPLGGGGAYPCQCRGFAAASPPVEVDAAGRDLLTGETVTLDEALAAIRDGDRDNP